MDRLRRKIIEALKRDASSAKPITEARDINYDDYGWEESLEEILYEAKVLREDDNLKGDQTKRFKVGDVIMSKFYSPASRKVVQAPHRILIITAKDIVSGVVQYQGFELSSKAEKANVNSRFSNNLYIADYATILSRGPDPHKEAIIRVDDLVRFTNKDLSSSGSYKGSVTTEFLQFVQQGYNNYLNNRDNSNMQWS